VNDRSAVLWLRRDLRRGDHPALLAASRATTAAVNPVFVIDPALWGSAGEVRRAWVAASVRAAREQYERRLTVLLGDPATVLPAFAARLGAGSVHVSGESTPYGRRRDAAVAAALGCPLVVTGTPYAVDPGTVLNRTGEPYKVFTAFARAWREAGSPGPAPDPERLELGDVEKDSDAERALAGAVTDLALPPAGEEAALSRWQDFLDRAVDDYAGERDRPDHAGTSGLSPYLKVGAIHPRTLVAGAAGVSTFVDELIWREFYADVLRHRPDSAWRDLRPELAALRYDDPGDAFESWCRGETGYPIVDAGMRQLLATGWMHNRVRMITASFLTKDLHAWWPAGARYFLDRLVDGDLASNNHGWQWVAGTGTDAAPYFRVFNPVTQGRRFDPEGAYVRRWVPELRHLAGKAVHEPWRHDDGHAHGYPRPLVDHAEERREALDRYRVARS
jgi:deoxyribodipyrimidine photo-lyase